MAKSSRKRSRANRRSAVRGQRGGQREVAAERAALAQQRARLTRLRDPATAVREVADLIVGTWGDGLMPLLAMGLLHQVRGSDDLLPISEALGEWDPDSLVYLTFTAQVAHRLGDRDRVDLMLGRALEKAGPGVRLKLAGHLVEVGRRADALGIYADHLTDPEYDDVARDHRSALEDAYEDLAGPGPRSCPCGSGTAWSRCCRPREEAAVAAFTDRAPLDEFRQALVSFVDGSRFEPMVADHVREWLDEAQAEDWEPDEVLPLARIATEHAWLLAGGDEDNLLDALAADPATPAPLAAAAMTWREHIHYGLWQVADPDTEPGRWCVDLVTRRGRYVAFAPEQVEHLPRWSVLLGAVVPMGGAWRSIGAFLRLSPSEADAVCAAVRAHGEIVLAELMGSRPTESVLELARAPVPFGFASPYNVDAYADGPLPSPIASVLGKVTGVVLARMCGELHAHRATPPILTNTDGDPIVMIKARIRVNDARAAVRLATHADLEPADDDATRLSWYGKQIPAEQRKTMIAEMRAQLRAEGHADAEIEVPDTPGRWVRGTLQVRGREVRVELNSRQRLDRLVALLDEMGLDPVIVDQSRLDPREDMAWPAGRVPAYGGLAPAEVGWESQWLDEKVPALNNRTPRQAAKREDDARRLEAMLRQMEYDADILSHTGGHGIDTEWLRQQLDMGVEQFL